MRKYLKWEFWPMWFFYIPVYVVYLWYSLLARSFVFFSAANPGMYMGGFIDYSKFDVLKKIPEDLIPKTFLIEEENAYEQVQNHLLRGEIEYPFILKPDRGQRGFAVEKIKDEEELQEYLRQYKTRLVLQEYAGMPLEFGVLYYRYPNEERGHISSVVQKLFLTITGDGKSDLLTLIKNSERAQYYLKMLKKRYAEELDTVLPEGEEKILVEIGNHCKGSAFLNRNHLINDELIDTFDRISKEIDGFYFGRYDLRTNSIEDLYAGKVKILELNGANSEPAHIYDSNMPLFKAYRFMFKHWQTIYRIGTMNHKNGVNYMKFNEAVRVTRKHYKRRKEEEVMVD